MTKSFIKRKQYKNIDNFAKAGRVLVVYGPRQSGKTTMLREYYDKCADKKIWLQGDDVILKKELESRTVGKISPILGDSKLVIIDEAQYLEHVGLTLKFLVDTYKDKVFIVTGSSAFGLLHHTSEPLTGRASYINLYPIDMGEIESTFGRVHSLSYVESVLIYGSYPAVCNEGDKKMKESIVRELADAYMYKEVLEFEGIRNHEGVRSILKLLALQIGNDVSINEIANMVNLSRATAQNYLSVLEKSYIIASSQSVSTMNERKEIGKNKRYYFVDLGFRNSVISNFSPLDLRSDVGALWENFVFIERLKKHKHENKFVDMCFWRTYDGKEVDILEKENGNFLGLECKWREDKIKDSLIKSFNQRFADTKLLIVNRDNFMDFM